MTDEVQQITVEQLIAILQGLPPKAPVLVEGCDCIGICKGANIDLDGTVLIERIL